MSKRVNIYKPKIERVKNGNKVSIEIVDKRHEFVRERAVMDRTLEQYEVNEYNTVIQSGLYMEEVKKEDAKEGAPKRKRRTKEEIESDKQK